MSRNLTTTTAKYLPGEGLFAGWRDDVLTGRGPVVFPHSLPALEIVQGQVVLLGGAPGAGKTAFAMQAVVEALRMNEALRVLVANVEMSPEALMNRQLARLSGVNATTIRHRRFTDEHIPRIDAGLSTIESFVERLAFLSPPFGLENVAHAADAHGADVVVLDYLQRFTPPGNHADTRLRANATMDMIRQFASAGCSVIVLSAVGRSRDNAGRSTYAASSMSLASFRDSSELEFGADDAYLLGRVDEADTTVVRLEHLKARHDEMTSHNLRFDGGTQSFTLIADGALPPPAPPTSRRPRTNKPKRATPDPAFAPAALAALWGSTAPAADDAAIDDEGAA